MNKEEIINKIISELGRETIDKFSENENGNLAKVETISVADLVGQIYEMSIDDKWYELKREIVALGARLGVHESAIGVAAVLELMRELRKGQDASDLCEKETEINE